MTVTKFEIKNCNVQIEMGNFLFPLTGRNSDYKINKFYRKINLYKTNKINKFYQKINLYKTK